MERKTACRGGCNSGATRWVNTPRGELAVAKEVEVHLKEYPLGGLPADVAATVEGPTDVAATRGAGGLSTDVAAAV